MQSLSTSAKNLCDLDSMSSEAPLLISALQANRLPSVLQTLQALQGHRFF